MTLPAARIRAVCEELARGTSQRKTARRVGVSRGIVSLVAQGKRLPVDPVRRCEDGPSGPLVRCGTCGGMVQLPCVLCRTRALGAAPAQSGPEASPDLRLELRGEELERYEALRRS